MIYFGIAALVFALDWYLKDRAEKKLKDDTVREVAKDHILIRKLHNHGIALGILKDRPKAVLGGTAAMVAAVFLGLFHLLKNGGNTLQKLGCALMAGGGLNNLADRRKRGYVTDYFSFNVKCEKLRKLVFNLSDMFILLGAILTVSGELKKNIKKS
ncbi:MAG: signal peptidase II [Ruminococcus sp.]|jgi:signal peptidase II